MKVFIAIVNYNNSEVTLHCLESLRRAKINAGMSFELDVTIVDNGSDKNELLKLTKGIAQEELLVSKENLGYMGGLNLALSERNPTLYDYTILANNDLLFSDDFFMILERMSLGSEYGIICPDIETVDGIHQNPHEACEVSQIRKCMYSIYFCNYYLGRLMYQIKQLVKKISGKANRVKRWNEPCDLYLGYGAIYLLRPSFFKNLHSIKYPCFLMGEEYYFSKAAADVGLKLRFEPSLKVIHLEHASVDKVPSRKMYEFEKESYLDYRKFWNSIRFPK